MSERLIIIGARAMGREAYIYARDVGYEVKGFLDSNPAALNDYKGYPSILRSVEDYQPETEDRFVVALGDPKWKLYYVSIIEKKNGQFLSIIHPLSYIGKNIIIGEGSIICPQTTITADTVLGKHVIVNVGSTINHDNNIGDGTTICPGCHLAGHVQTGRGVFLGIGSVLIPNVKLGDNVFVAAGATVTKTFESGRLMGVPAICTRALLP